MNIIFLFYILNNIFQIIVNSEKNNIKLSIIIPVYNTENYLEQCLDSIINQSLKEIEIICIDDESKDNSLIILRKYQTKDKRIKVISKKNEGVGPTRNLGIELAKGEYLCFIDSDDYVDLKLYELAYKTAKKFNADLVAFRWHHFVGKIDKFKEKNTNFVPVFDVMEKLWDKASILPWNKIIRREIFKDKNVRFFPYDFAEDIFFNYNMYPRIKNISFIDKAFYHYREGRIGKLSRISYNQKFIKSNKMFPLLYESWKKGNFIKGRENLLLTFLFSIRARRCRRFYTFEKNCFKHIKNMHLLYNKNVIDSLKGGNRRKIFGLKRRFPDLICDNNIYNKKNIINNKCKIIEFSYIILNNNSNLEFIEFNIQSIISQTLNRFFNFEIIYINFNSNENFLNILNKYKSIENRIKIYNLNNNSNIIEAKNFGIKKSNGKYLTFINSIDYVDFDFFRFAYDKMKDEKLDLYSSNLSYFCEEFDNYEEYWYENEIENINTILNKLDYNIYGKIYKSDLIKNINFLSFDNNEIVENIYFNTIVFSKADVIGFNIGKYYHKRNLNCSSNNNIFNKNVDNNFDSLITELIDYWINDKNVNNENHFLENLIDNIFINLNVKYDLKYKEKIKKYFKMLL